jgi:hypothetical protein
MYTERAYKNPCESVFFTERAKKNPWLRCKPGAVCPSPGWGDLRDVDDADEWVSGFLRESGSRKDRNGSCTLGKVLRDGAGWNTDCADLTDFHGEGKERIR